MARLNLRIPDTTMVALRHELAREREYRGRKYSMNDLCALKLATNGTQVRHTTDTGTLTIPRVPPPPPVPMRVSGPSFERFYGASAQQVPQPERMVQVATPLVIEDNTVSGWIAELNAEPEPKEPEVARMESEGAPDGHLDH